MKKYIFTGLIILFITMPAFGAITAYKHYNDGLGSWDQTLTTSSLWSDIVGTGGAITHLPGGKGDFPASNSAFRGCVEFTPPTVLYHHDYDGVIWNDTEGTIEVWIAPHWNGENQGGVHPGGAYQDVIIGDGIIEAPCIQGFNVYFFDNNWGLTPGYQLFISFTDNDGAAIYEHYEVGNTMDWIAGEWHHICVSWDAIEVMAGLDGVIFMKKTRNGGFNFDNGGYLFGMNRGSGPENSWDGWVDDLAIHNTALYTNLGDVNDTFTAPTGPNVPINDKKAWVPIPSTRTTVDKIAGSTLSWNAGTGAITHKVYWGADLAEVAGRTVAPIDVVRAVDGNTTPTPTLPSIDTTYYWIVDEVDSTPTTHAGDLWQYSIVPYLIVDDMEDYDLSGDPDTGNQIYDIWVDGYYGTSGSAVAAQPDGFEDTIKAMEYKYSNTGTSPYGPSGYPYYSEIVADTSNLDCGSDWTVEGVAWLQLNFKGQLSNDPNERMYVAIEDSEPNFTMVQYGLPDSYSNPEWTEDMNDIKSDTWDSFGWAIDLKSFTGVNLADVQKVYIGFGERGKVNDGSRSGAPAGQYQGTVVFDEIRLLVPGVYNPSAIVPLSADLYDDGTVNFSDLAILASEYLLIEDDGMWPDP